MKKEEAPYLSVGGFAIYFRCLLGRACPRLSKANEAKEAKKRYEAATCRSHEVVNLNAPTRLSVVSQAQIPAPGFG